MLARRAEGIRSLLRWHRRIGLAATLFVIISVLTGVALNHVDDLALDKIMVKNQWLMAQYGLAPKGTPVGVNVGRMWISWVDGTVYAGENAGQPLGALIGAIRDPDFLAVAGPNRILLLRPGGELVEMVEGYHLPGTINAIGLSGRGEIVVLSGNDRFASDGSLSGWTPLGDRAVTWSTVQKPPAAVRKATLERFRGKGLPLDRILLDIHSGHIFGFWGAIVMDVAAILFLVLAITGVVVSLRRNGGTKTNGNGNGNGPSS